MGDDQADHVAMADTHNDILLLIYFTESGDFFHRTCLGLFKAFPIRKPHSAGTFLDLLP